MAAGMSRGEVQKPPTPYPFIHGRSERSQNAYGQMLWYAWGRMDAPGSADVAAVGTVDEGFRLALLWANAVEDYTLQVTGWLPALPDFFVEYLQRLEPAEPPAVELSDAVLAAAGNDASQADLDALDAAWVASGRTEEDAMGLSRADRVSALRSVAAVEVSPEPAVQLEAIAEPE